MAQFIQIDPAGINGSNPYPGTMINVDYINGHAFYGDSGDLQVVYIPLKNNASSFAYVEYSTEAAAAEALRQINNALFRDNPGGLVIDIAGVVSSLEYTDS